MLTKNSIEKIKKSKRCKNRLAYELNINPRTLETYLGNNHLLLTTELAVKIISEELDLKKSEILEKEKVTA